MYESFLCSRMGGCVWGVSLKGCLGNDGNKAQE